MVCKFIENTVSRGQVNESLAIKKSLSHYYHAILQVVLFLLTQYE